MSALCRIGGASVAYVHTNRRPHTDGPILDLQHPQRRLPEVGGQLWAFHFPQRYML
jgi:hypothetical protein